MDQKLLRQTENNISQNLRGWVTTEEMIENLPNKVTLYDITKIKEYVNSRDKIHIRTTDSTATKSAYFIKHKTENRFQEYKNQIPEETYQIFNNWAGKGKAPRVIVALITYLTSEDKDTMSDVANEQGCCTASIRNNKQDMKEDLREKGLKVYDRQHP